MEFLGFNVNTLSMELSLPAINNSGSVSKIIRGRADISPPPLSRLIGKLNAANQVIPPAPLFYKYLQMDLSEALRRSGQNYDARGHSGGLESVREGQNKTVSILLYCSSWTMHQQ